MKLIESNNNNIGYDLEFKRRKKLNHYQNYKFKVGMTSDEISEIISERLMEITREMFEKSKLKSH